MTMQPQFLSAEKAAEMLDIHPMNQHLQNHFIMAMADV